MADPLVIQCSICGAKNRVPREKLEQGLLPVCGRCKNPLSLDSKVDSKPVTVTDATFAAEVERAALPVLVDLWAPWCGPCRMISPVLEALAIEMAGRVRVAKLNIDENPATTARFNIQSIPALLIFRGGKEVDRMVGVRPKSEIVRRLEQLLAA
jgi:thioredoxin 2